MSVYRVAFEWSATCPVLSSPVPDKQTHGSLLQVCPFLLVFGCEGAFKLIWMSHNCTCFYLLVFLAGREAGSVKVKTEDWELGPS